MNSITLSQIEIFVNFKLEIIRIRERFWAYKKYSHCYIVYSNSIKIIK